MNEKGSPFRTPLLLRPLLLLPQQTGCGREERSHWKNGYPHTCSILWYFPIGLLVPTTTDEQSNKHSTSPKERVTLHAFKTPLGILPSNINLQPRARLLHGHRTSIFARSPSPLFAHDIPRNHPFLLLLQGEGKRVKDNKEERAENKKERENVKDAGEKRQGKREIRR